MQTVEFSTPVKFGETIIDTIKVEKLGFVGFSDIWTAAAAKGTKDLMKNIRRGRIARQVHFMAAEKRIVPTDPDISTLPISVMKPILTLLDAESGPPGRVLEPVGDGMTTPIVYKLGTPFKSSNSKGEGEVIEELEFLASTYGEIEDMLAAPNDIQAALILIKTVAKPLGSKFQRLPGWAVDRLTMSDGVMIVNEVLKSF